MVEASLFRGLAVVVEREEEQHRLESWEKEDILQGIILLLLEVVQNTTLYSLSPAG